MKYSYEEAKLAAEKYIRQQDFRENDNGLYQFAKRNKFINDICGHMQTKRYRYTEDVLRNEALKYNTRSEFQYKNQKMYNVVRLRGKEFLDDLCSHMKSLKSTSDCVYICKIENTNTYKIGITTFNGKKDRLKEISYSIKKDVKLINKTKVINPIELEKELLLLGEKDNSFDCSGKTEFRILTLVELNKAIKLIEKGGL